jgi:hypothetical protein
MRLGLTGGALLALGPFVLNACSPYGNTLEPDANGLRLPKKFSSRVVATTGVIVPGTSYAWHAEPDGGATFATPDGGWIYVSNSERSSGLGGAGMIRFDDSGVIVDARSILSGTERNCAGGPTPWGTWLSCEETSRGAVFECDPFGVAAATRLDSLGWFSHEAAAVDPDAGVVYLTEDRTDGALYRYVPGAYPDLSSGVLEVLTGPDTALGWTPVPNPTPTPAETSTRHQVVGVRRFAGGEGAWWHGDRLYFSTKYDDRVWTYRPATSELTVIYDLATTTEPVLSGVDNVTVTGPGDVFVAEDGGDMQLCFISNYGTAVFAQLDGVTGSEITGPAFDPSGTRLYFSSQRNPGTTYEITGPFRQAPVS